MGFGSGQRSVVSWDRIRAGAPRTPTPTPHRGEAGLDDLAGEGQLRVVGRLLLGSLELVVDAWAGLGSGVWVRVRLRVSARVSVRVRVSARVRVRLGAPFSIMSCLSSFSVASAAWKSQPPPPTASSEAAPLPPSGPPRCLHPPGPGSGSGPGPGPGPSGSGSGSGSGVGVAVGFGSGQVTVRVRQRPGGAGTRARLGMRVRRGLSGPRSCAAQPPAAARAAAPSVVRLALALDEELRRAEACVASGCRRVWQGPETVRWRTELPTEPTIAEQARTPADAVAHP